MPNVIGDFTWVGWDYLGEVGIGAPAYVANEDGSMILEREYPFLTAVSGDLDITGWRRPISYYREIVFGLRSEPYIAVGRPERHGQALPVQSPWSWSDTVSSWSWPEHDGAPVSVEVYANADEVALLLDGEEVGRSAVGELRPRVAEFETVYRSGELRAVAYASGVEVGRTALRTAGPATLTATADRLQLADTDAELAFVAIELRDEAGLLIVAEDRPVTVTVSGAGVLAGMCSADPSTTERFDSDTWRTYDGRALAVIRPTGAGGIRVSVSADGLDPVEIELAVS